MKFLALETEMPSVPTTAFTSEIKNAEAWRVWELYQQGFIRESYFRADRSDAVLIMECRDIQEAQSVIQSLPMVAEGLIKFEIIPLMPYPGFARLFAC